MKVCRGGVMVWRCVGEVSWCVGEVSWCGGV